MNDLVAAIRIKGMRDGLLVSLPEGEWDQQSRALLSQIDAQQSFFQGARLALDVGAQVIKVNEMVELRDRLSDRNVSLWAIISESPTTEQTAQLLGLATRVSKPRPEELPNIEAAPVPEETALFVNRTLRSGTRIEFPGTVVVLGDVNPGAEIVGQGNIVIWGRLRGAAHAGSAGSTAAVVCALDLSPLRLQIGDQILQVSPNREGGKPEMALVRDGNLIIEPWQPGTGVAPA
jgi:septum site-determining protein MinC